MPTIKTVMLLAEQRAALGTGAKYGLTPSYRLRCQAVLLKTDRHTSQEVAHRLGCCEMSVNNWVNRYQAQGLAGLKTRDRAWRG